MLRSVRYGAGVLAVVLLMFLPLLGIPSDDLDPSTETSRITSYDAKFVVDDQGTLHATETLTVEFPIERHGIYRFFDLADPVDDHVLFIPHDISVTRDGKADQLSLSHRDRGRYVVARIGDPDRTVGGRHTYRIRYTIAGTLSDPATSGRYRTGSRFYWNLVPGGWQMPIAKSTLSATLPAAPGPVRCAIGRATDTGCTASVTGKTLRVSTGRLAPNTPVTVQTPISLAQPGQTRLPWGLSLDPVFGHSLVVAVLFVLLALAALVGGYLLARSVREEDPAYPLMYAPPDGIGPAQGAYLMTERVDDDAYAATMLELGEKGVATIEHTGEARDGSWRITGQSGDWDTLDAVTRRTAKDLGVSEGHTFTTKPAEVADGQDMQRARNRFETEVKTWASEAGLIELKKLPVVGRLAVRASGGIALFLFVLNIFHFTLSGLPFGLFAVMALPLLDKRSATMRTATGREAWSRIGGFRRVLGTASSEARFDFAGRQELYLQYVPWAVAFGVGDVWAQKYRVEMQAEPPLPTYLAGGWVPVGGSLGGSLGGFSDSFNTSVGSAISAYEATQSSSSGGGGGGFSGGGGGGGGGGGSW